ncbi:MAG: PAS domain S-box protein [Vicinamibacterales bacterium]
MPTTSSTISKYGIALLAVAVAILIRVALTPWMGPAFPLATMFSAVAFVVWYGGWGPALLTALLGWFAAGYVFRSGQGYYGPSFSFNEAVSFVVYLLSNLSVIVLGEAMRAAQRRLENQQEKLTTMNLALENKVEAQSLLAAIVASSDDAIVSKTLDGRITSWNKGAERLFGYTAHEAIGQPIHLIVPPEGRDEVARILDRIRHGERVDQLEVVRVRKGGKRLTVSITVSPVHDRHGLIIGASKTARDITTRKEWEANLVRSEEAQRLLVGIHDATRGLQDPSAVMRETVTRVGMHFDVTRCAYGEVSDDQRHIAITPGYSKDVPAVAGRYPLDVFGPLMAGELKAGRTVAVNDVLTDPLTDTPLAHESYARIQIGSLVCAPLLRGGKLTAVLMMSDGKPREWTTDDARLLEQVAERTLYAVEGARAMHALRENRDVLQFAMSAGRMGAWSRELAADSVWWSPELAVLFGFDADDANYSRDRLLSLLPDEARVRVTAAIETALARREDYVVEFQFRHAKTGEWRWMEARGRAQYDAHGKPTMLYGLGIDITERVRAVEALREADRRKDEFLATLAHELRNPLAPISSGLHILRTGADDPMLANTAREIMERQVAQMVRLVDDLLDVARITTGKVELRRQQLDLADAIRDAVETSRPLFEQNGQQLTVSLPERPVFTHADRTRLAQVFANLLNNSAKFSDRGQPIAIALTQEGGDAVVRVRDAGVGITPEALPKIFDMFGQADGDGSRKAGGLGIGLSLVKRIAEMHGGTVEAHSEGVGRGSEFVVRIPLIAAHAPAVDREQPAANAPTSKRRILVVDDNTDAAESLAALLSINGHETRLAHDGLQAMEAARAFRPDVVFLDIGMPALDGHETARRIRQEPWGKEMVLVALTGWGQTEDRRRSLEAGFNHHLVKPADPIVVAKLISSLA